MMACSRKETFCTRRVKCERGRVQQFGIPGMWGENRILLENRTYVGILFVGIRVHNESSMYVGIVRMKLKGVTWNSINI